MKHVFRDGEVEDYQKYLVEFKMKRTFAFSHQQFASMINCEMMERQAAKYILSLSVSTFSVNEINLSSLTFSFSYPSLSSIHHLITLQTSATFSFSMISEEKNYENASFANRKKKWKCMRIMRWWVCDILSNSVLPSFMSF